MKHGGAASQTYCAFISTHPTYVCSIKNLNIMLALELYKKRIRVAGHRFAHANDLNTSSLSTMNRDGRIVIIVYAITRTTVAT